MRKKKIVCAVGALAVAVLLTGTPFRTASAANYENKAYTYEYKSDGEHSHTGWRTKGYNGSEIPHGYVYAYCSYGLDSSIAVRKRQSNDAGVKCTDYVTVPYYTHTNIKNDFNKSVYTQICLWVRTNSSKENASTFGVWSPDSSQAYGHIVG